MQSSHHFLCGIILYKIIVVDIFVTSLDVLTLLYLFKTVDSLGKLFAYFWLVLVQQTPLQNVREYVFFVVSSQTHDKIPHFSSNSECSVL